MRAHECPCVCVYVHSFDSTTVYDTVCMQFRIRPKQKEKQPNSQCDSKRRTSHTQNIYLTKTIYANYTARSLKEKHSHFSLAHSEIKSDLIEEKKTVRNKSDENLVNRKIDGILRGKEKLFR